MFGTPHLGNDKIINRRGRQTTDHPIHSHRRISPNVSIVRPRQSEQLNPPLTNRRRRFRRQPPHLILQLDDPRVQSLDDFARRGGKPHAVLAVMPRRGVAFHGIRELLGAAAAGAQARAGIIGRGHAFGAAVAEASDAVQPAVRQRLYACGPSLSSPLLQIILAAPPAPARRARPPRQKLSLRPRFRVSALDFWRPLPQVVRKIGLTKNKKR